MKKTLTLLALGSAAGALIAYGASTIGRRTVRKYVQKKAATDMEKKFTDGRLHAAA